MCSETKKPRRYIDRSEAASALRRGRSIEYIAGFFDHAEGPAVRYIIISPDADIFVVRLYESLESDQSDFYSFPEADPSLEQGEPQQALELATFEEVLTWLEMQYPGSSQKLLNQGVAEAEYWDVRG